MGLFDLFKKKKKHIYCARCKKITEDETKWIGSHRFCEKCAASKHSLEQQLIQIDSIIINVIAERHLNSQPAFINEIKEKAVCFLKNYITDSNHSFTFYWSEYPMGATHSKEFRKIDSVWCIYQYDYDKTPREKKTPYPNINDDNILESFIRVLLDEDKYR